MAKQIEVQFSTPLQPIKTQTDNPSDSVTKSAKKTQRKYKVSAKCKVKKAFSSKHVLTAIRLVNTDQYLSSAASRIYTVLCCVQDSSCFDFERWLCKVVGITPETGYRHLASLIGKGWISEQKIKQGKKVARIEYTLHIKES